MPKVKALMHFEHHGCREVGAVFDVSDKHAEALERKGLVERVEAAADSGAQDKAQTKPSAPRRRAPVDPKTVKPAGPNSTVDGGQIDLTHDQQQEAVEENPAEQDAAAGAPIADVIEQQDPAKD